MSFPLDVMKHRIGGGSASWTDSIGWRAP
jgi:hypothetical protein